MVGTGDVEDEGNHSAVRPLVRSVPTELPQPGRNDAGTWCVRGSFQCQPLSDQVFAVAGEGIQKAQAGSRRQLAYGRDLHQG